MCLKNKAYNLTKNFTVAIDGTAASGKGLIAKMLAQEFNLECLASGMLYRKLAYLCLKNNIPANSNYINYLSLNLINFKLEDKVDLNNEEIAQFASVVAIKQNIRNNINSCLTVIINKHKRIVVEGRDIGTVLLPESDLKIFIDADVNTRALRRFKQLQEQKKICILSEVLKQIHKRDNLDKNRYSSPLKTASDALIIDSTNLSPFQVIEKIKAFIG